MFFELNVPAPQELRTFRAPPAYRITGAVVWLVLLLGCLVAVSLTGSLPAIAGALCSAYLVASVLVARIEIDDRCIRKVGALSTQEVRLDEISGYRIETRRGGRWLTLAGRDGRSLLAILAHSSDKDQLLAWASKNFPDLAWVEDRDELADALASDRLGANEAERLDAIERARKWSVWLNATAGLTSAWAVFFPLPPHWPEVAVLLFPIAAVALVLRFRGALLLAAKDKGTLPGVFLSLAIPVLALSIRATLDWQLLELGSFWAPFAILAGATFWIAMRLYRPAPYLRSVVFMFAVLSLLYGYGSVAILNGILDFEETTYEAPILAKGIQDGRRPNLILTLGPWGSQTTPTEMRVRRDVYDALEAGDTLTIHEGRGSLGIPWRRIENKP